MSKTIQIIFIETHVSRGVQTSTVYQSPRDLQRETPRMDECIPPSPVGEAPYADTQESIQADSKIDDDVPTTETMEEGTNTSVTIPAIMEEFQDPPPMISPISTPQHMHTWENINSRMNIWDNYTHSSNQNYIDNIDSPTWLLNHFSLNNNNNKNHIPSDWESVVPSSSCSSFLGFSPVYRPPSPSSSERSITLTPDSSVYFTSHSQQSITTSCSSSTTQVPSRVSSDIFRDMPFPMDPVHSPTRPESPIPGCSWWGTDQYVPPTDGTGRPVPSPPPSPPNSDSSNEDNLGKLYQELFGDSRSNSLGGFTPDHERTFHWESPSGWFSPSSSEGSPSSEGTLF